MPKFSDWIRSPGTGGPPTRDGIRQLGFAFLSEVVDLAAKALRVDVVQSFTAGEKTQGRANLGVVIGTNVQAYDAGLQSLSALAGGANLLPYMTGIDVYATTSLTAFARTILDDANAAAVQTTLGLVPGTDVQAYDAGLQSISGLATATDKMIYTTALDVYAVTDLTPYARTLLDDANAGAALTTLGVSAFIQTLLDDADAAAAKTTLVLNNVDNTSDANKPVSTAQQTALNLKANLASPPLTGNPTAPTQAALNNSTRIATTAYVEAAVAAGGGGFSSANQTITLGSTVSVAHGLGAIPAIVQFDLICTIAEFGWTVGQITQVSCGILAFSGIGNGLIGVGMEKTTTNIIARYPSGSIYVPNKTANDGTAAAITPANWRLIIRAKL